MGNIGRKLQRSLQSRSQGYNFGCRLWEGIAVSPAAGIPGPVCLPAPFNSASCDDSRKYLLLAKVGVWQGPPKALVAPKPVSSIRTMRTLGAPLGGRSSLIGGYLVSGSLAS